MKASEVFTPGRFPTHTFVDEHLESKRQDLLDTLDAGSMLVSISGPSKSGKTVFVEQSLGRENLIQITGAGVNTPEDLWMRVFDIIGTNVPKTVTSTAGSITKTGGSVSLEGNAIVAARVPCSGVIPPAPPPRRSRGGARTSGDRLHG